MNALTSLFHFLVWVEMEWYEPIIALQALVSSCSECRLHGERLKPRMQDVEDAEFDFSNAWTRRQRDIAHKKVLESKWWQTAITRELQWHLTEQHGIILEEPAWADQSSLRDESDNEETLDVLMQTFDANAESLCIY